MLDLQKVVNEALKEERLIAFREGYKLGRVDSGLLSWKVEDLNRMKERAEIYVYESEEE